MRDAVTQHAQIAVGAGRQQEREFHRRRLQQSPQVRLGEVLETGGRLEHALRGRRPYVGAAVEDAVDRGGGDPGGGGNVCNAAAADLHFHQNTSEGALQFSPMALTLPEACNTQHQNTSTKRPGHRWPVPAATAPAGNRSASGAHKGDMMSNRLSPASPQSRRPWRCVGPRCEPRARTPRRPSSSATGT